MTSVEADMQINRSRRRLVSGLGALALIPLLPRKLLADVPPLTGHTMGTRYRVVLAEQPRDIDLRSLRHSILGILRSTESSMSLYRPESELCQLNNQPPGRPFALSASTRRVLNSAMDICEQSEGAFNPLAGDLAQSWGFNPDHLHRKENRQQPSWKNPASTSIRWQGNQLVKAGSPVTVDLNGIAKGDAIDQIGLLLDSQGISNYLVEIGGEVLTRGVGPGGKCWLVGIEHPTGGIDRIVELSNNALATSGDYVDFYHHNGQRISHLMDPRTGRPVNHSLASVSVISETAMAADAWATALMVLGPEDGVSLAFSEGMAASFTIRESDEYRSVLTPAFASYAVQHKATERTL